MYKRRMKVFMALVAVVSVAMAARLTDLQIVRGRSYRRQYEEMLRNTERLPALRGRILDRNGFILAMNEPCYDLCLDYRFITRDARWIKARQREMARARGVPFEQAKPLYDRRAEKTWSAVRTAALEMRTRKLKVKRLSEEQVKGALEDLKGALIKIIRRVQRIRRGVGTDVREQRDVHPVVPGLDEAAAAMIRTKLEDTVGTVVRPSSDRRYPYGPAACHIIGFMAPVTADDLRRHNIPSREASWFVRNERNYLAGDRIGRSGVEKMCERRLRGNRGFRIRQSGKEAHVTPAHPGGDVHLTLDVRLQKDITGLMGGRNGCAVVLSVPGREVLAMVSIPTYDLNSYRRDYSRLVADGLNLPLLHRAVARRYAPGSTMKPLAALAGLGSGLLTAGTTYHCSGRLFANVAGFRCWKTGGHGDLALVEAIKRSCNVYFYNVGQGMGVEMMGEWYRMFGFADKPGTGLPEERAGKVPVSGTPGIARMLAIGQGPVAATPLHVANVMATIAAGGRFRSPVIALEGGPRPVRRSLQVSSSQVDVVRRGMHKVVSEPGGTAYKYFNMNPPPVECCGKTGTAEMPPHTADLNGNGRIDPGEMLAGDMAWCVGFAPYRDPKVAFAVVVEYVISGGGASNAGPIARDIVHLCARYGYCR